MKATEQYFPGALFSQLYKVVLTYETVDEILRCDRLIKSQYRARGAVIMLDKVVLTFDGPLIKILTCTLYFP